MNIAIITTLTPETHYSRYLVVALEHNHPKEMNFFVYANKVENIKDVGEVNVVQCWTYSWMYPFQIINQVIKDKIDVVHLQYEINMYGGPVLSLLFPVLVFLLKCFRRKVVVTVHAIVTKDVFDLKFLKTFSRFTKPFMLFVCRESIWVVYKTICTFSNRIIVHTCLMRDLLKLEYGVNEKKISVIRHGVCNGEILGSAKVVNLNIVDKKIILFFGYLVKRKNIETLIDAFKTVQAHHKNYVLVLAGGALKGQEQYVEDLKRRVESFGLVEQVVFTGFLSEQEIANLFLSSEFVVLPANYSISASGPLAQAIAFSKPVIVPDIGNFSEEILNGVDGLFYTSMDSQSLSAAMLRLIGDVKLLGDISNNMKRKACDRGWANVAKFTIDVYKNANQN